MRCHFDMLWFPTMHCAGCSSCILYGYVNDLNEQTVTDALLRQAILTTLIGRRCPVSSA